MQADAEANKDMLSKKRKKGEVEVGFEDSKKSLQDVKVVYMQVYLELMVRLSC